LTPAVFAVSAEVAVVRLHTQSSVWGFSAKADYKEGAVCVYGEVFETMGFVAVRWLKHLYWARYLDESFWRLAAWLGVLWGGVLIRLVW